MSEIVRHAYAQARLQARYGGLPEPSEWRRLEATGNLTHFLNSVRTTPMKPWVVNLSPQSDVHAIEQTLRRMFREQVRQVADWYPAAWLPAFAWFERLVDLPAIAHLLERSDLPHWVREDPVLQPYALDLLPLRLQALSSSPYAPIAAGHAQGKKPWEAWAEEWRRRWPADLSPARREPLGRLLELFARQRTVLLEGGLADSRVARDRLAADLTRLFRHHTHQPATGFTYLALAGIHLERLRGNLLRLHLFGRNGEAAA